MLSCNCFTRSTFTKGVSGICLAASNKKNVISKSINQLVLPRLYISTKKIYNSQVYSNYSKENRFTNYIPLTQPYQRSIQTSSSYFDDYQIVHTPPFAESVTEGDVRWDKGVGDEVAEDEVVGEIETDKTALPIVSPAAGVIEELFIEDGERVEKGDQLFKLKLGAGGGGSVPKTEKSAEIEQAAPSSPPPPPPSPPPADVSSSHAGPAPQQQPPVTPPPKQPMAVRSPTPAPAPPPRQAPVAVQEGSNEVKEVKEAPTRLTGTRNETKVKMNRMRLRIAQRLKDAQNTNAMLTTFNEIDMSNAMAMRKQYKDLFLKKHNMKLGFMSAFIKASSVALQQMPTVNAVIEDNYVIYRDFVDVSVAVATPKGLVVPVLRDVQHMNFADIERGMNLLGEKARSGTLAIEDMDGGTFTISNGGVFGSLMGTPIINPPQSAILGMHGIFDRPVAIQGKVEIRPMMYIALTYDHRLIDGREAVTFLRKIKQNVEDPTAMFLDI